MKMSSIAFMLASFALASAQPETLPLCSSPEADAKHSDFGQEGLCIGPQARNQRRRAQTTSPIEPPAEDDFTFVVNSGLGLDTSCTYRAGSPLVFTVKISRFFGDIPTLLDAGLISDTAALTLPAWDVDYAQGEQDEVSINGNKLSPYLTGENEVWKLNTYYVPLSMLNFPSDPGAGGTVVPANNVISVNIDIGNDGWCVAIDWAAIQLRQAPRPVVLFHGLLSDGDVWKSHSTTSVSPHDATADLGNYSSIQSNADLIAARVAAAQARFGVREVDIVAHSKGGLDARHYAETATDVVDLIQIAAPNAGTPLADFGQLVSIAALSVSNTVVINYFASKAAVQLTTDYMTTYNSIHGLNGDVSYTVMAGDYDTGCASTDLFCRTLDRLLLAVSGSPGDTIVPKWSAHNLVGTSKLVFSSVGSDESAKHRPLIESAQVFDQIQGSVATGLGTSLSATDPDCQITRVLAGSVAQSATFTASLDLDGTTEAYIVLSFPSGMLGFTLTSPDDTVIDPTYATNNPTVAGYESSVFYDGNIAVYNLRNPAVGSWTVQVTGDAVVGAQTVFVVNAFLFQPDIKLEAWLATPSVLVGTPLVYLAKPTDSGSPITSATAKATVALPDGTLTTVTLLDNGVYPDTVANDGVYTGSLINTSQSGNYRAAVSVEKAGSPSFTREAFVLGTAATSTVSSSIRGENPRDTDGDTLYNFLDINFYITAEVTGNFLLMATLTDSAGNEQTVSQPVNIANVATPVTVTFDGRTIYDNGVNGPYMLSSVRLAVESEFVLAVVADLVDVYSTAAYNYNQFQRNPLRLVGGTTNPVDNNANSLYDLLNINLVVESDIVGAYQWSATLRDEYDKELDFDYGSVTLAKGSNTLGLSFAGIKIGNNFVDGPYFVSDFILFGSSSSVPSLVIGSKAYTTDALLWTQFERTLSPPSKSPTSRPTKPTLAPSAKPTLAPSAKPTLAPSAKPTASPTKKPTLAPSAKPTLAPSAKPTSAKPTAIPTAKPTGAPTKAPTKIPTRSPTSAPSDFPSSYPSLMPSSQPSVVVQTIRTPGSISTNKEFCSFSDAERQAFTEAALASIEEFACTGSETCAASLTSSCGQDLTAQRELSSSRQLQASNNWQVEYVVVDTFTCEKASCSSPSDVAKVNAIVEMITTNMNDSMSSGQFKETFAVKIIQSAALNSNLVECLMVWGTVGAAETDVGGTGTGRTGVFYPDWEHNSGTCLQDGNQPAYMELSTSWLSSSLEDCCSRFYPGWNFNKCMNPSGSGLWYVSHANGKCVTDCDEANGGTCGGFANLLSNNLYSNPRSCCEAELFYRYLEFCEADSLLSECYEGTGLFYRGDNGGKEVCARDCDPASGDNTCGGIVEDAYIVLYETAEECCTAEYNWINVDLCAARTTQTSFGKYWPDKVNSKCLKDSEMPSGQLDVEVYDSLEECCASGIFWLSKAKCFAASGVASEELGSSKFYVDWMNQYCVQDCEGAAPCGGLAQAWDPLYNSASDCCARLPGRTAQNCVYK
eukprot:CCRYP_020032-RA/>CCRYP_020032-RA protein AED:0.05 eAED:0.35 QI:142/0.71/0.62/1/0.71/0.5/8/50/1510